MSDSFNDFVNSANADGLTMVKSVELIENKLNLVILSDLEISSENSSTHQSFKDWKTSLNKENAFYLNMYDNLVHYDFYNGIGQMNLAMLYRYINTVREKLKAYNRVIHCVRNIHQKSWDIAVFLICAYMIVEEHWTAHQTYTKISQQFNAKCLCIPIMVSSYLSCSVYSVTVQEYVNTFFKAKWFGFFDFDDFNLLEYETHATVNSGDFNWIVPGRLLAFSTPYSRDGVNNSGYRRHSPAFYYQYFQRHQVKHVVRLNGPTYNGQRTFVDEANIQFADMPMSDGFPPSDVAISFFFSLCEQYIDDPLQSSNNAINEPPENNGGNTFKCGGAVAVHCKAGLGRTGCLIASYIVKHWPFTALEAIAWVRLCRPGSVNGVQKRWLVGKERWLKRDGVQWQMQKSIPDGQYIQFTNGLYSFKRHGSYADTYRFVNLPHSSCIISAISSCCSMTPCETSCCTLN